MNSFIDNHNWHPSEDKNPYFLFSSAFLSTLIPPDSTSSVLLPTAGKSNMGLETVIITVSWKHHSCLGNAIVVTKWDGSRIGVMTSICPLTFWNFENIEQMRLEVEIILVTQVWK